MTRNPHTARRLRRSALMLTAAVLLSGCIFGDGDDSDRIATVFTSQDAERFITNMQAEIDYLAANDPPAAERLSNAIIQIAGIEGLSVDPEAFQEKEGPALPDFTSIDPKSPNSLRLVHRALEDRLDRGVVVADFPIIADDSLQVGVEKYQEAAGEAMKVLEERRGELRDRQEQVRSIGGQVAFVKPILGEWDGAETGLTGQIINLGPLPLVEMGLRVSKPEDDFEVPSGPSEVTMADLLITFEPPLRSKETRTLRGHTMTVEGEVPEGSESLTGSVVVAVRHVTPLGGGRLTGDEFTPALDYLEEMQRQLQAFTDEAPQKIRALTFKIGQ